MNDKEKLISLLILTDPNPYICESESGSCELTTCTECRARSTADLLIENDFLPVVRCKDCEYSYDEVSYLCCAHGVCVDCEVPPNFYCAEGKRKEPDE